VGWELNSGIYALYFVGFFYLFMHFLKGASKLMFTEGLETDTVAIQITREEVHHYCKAIGEKNPIFHNPDAARKAGYSDVVLPAAYPVLFWKYIHIL